MINGRNHILPLHAADADQFYPMVSTSENRIGFMKFMVGGEYTIAFAKSLGELKMAYPKTNAKRRLELKSIHKLLAK